MKKLMSIITVLIIVPVFFAASYASENEHGERHEYERAGYHDRYPGKFYGTIEGMPETGRAGTWIINGREVLVTNSTRIEEEYGRAAQGAYVEVKGNYAGKIFTAYEIEVKGESGYREHAPRGGKTLKGTSHDYTPHQERTYNIKLGGIIEAVPEGGYEGLWIIDGRTVEVTGRTLIDETGGRVVIGAYAKVKGVRTADAITAYEIEIGANKK